MDIALLIDSLYRGGTEVQVALIAKGLSERGHRVTVITFRGGGELGNEIEQAGIPIVHLGRGVLRINALRKFLRSSKTDVAYAFLPSSSIRLSLSAVGLRRLSTVWGVRSSEFDWALYRRKARTVSELARIISHAPDCIIANSEKGRTDHIKLGYPRKNFFVIPNAIDLQAYQFDSAGRSKLRLSWGIGDEDFVVGMLARFDPIKGHDLFSRTIQQLGGRIPGLKIVVAGSGHNEAKSTFRAAVEMAHPRKDLVMLDRAEDVAGFMSAVDVLVVPSRSEGFPNVAAEAMACGVPVVGFDVGDLASIVRSPGVVVPFGDTALLATSISNVFEESRNGIVRSDQRDWISLNFSSEQVIDLLEKTLTKIHKAKLSSKSTGVEPRKTVWTRLASRRSNRV